MSERGSTWYKRDPICFMDGVEGMGPELIGAYAYVLDLIYSRNGYSRRDDGALAGRMGCSKRKATALVSALIERGKIEVHGDYLTHKHAVNHANTTRALTEQRANAGRKGGEKSGEVRKNNGLCEASDSSKTNQIREDKIREDKNTPLPPKGNGYTAEFEDWWKKYPRKKNKGDAFKAFQKAKRIVGADRLFSALSEQLPFLEREAQRDGGQYCPHPASWLNAGSYDDEPTQPQTNLMTQIANGEYDPWNSNASDNVLPLSRARLPRD